MRVRVREQLTDGDLFCCYVESRPSSHLDRRGCSVRGASGSLSTKPSQAKTKRNASDWRSSDVELLLIRQFWVGKGEKGSIWRRIGDGGRTNE